MEILRKRAALAAKLNNESLQRSARASSGNLKGTKDLLKSLVLVGVDEFDVNPDLINCLNGVLNLRTGELIPHHFSQKFTYSLPVPYDSLADYTEWIKFLQKAVGNDPELLDYIQTAAGYSLTGHTRGEVLFLLFGPTRSGKGVFIETLLKILGGMPLAIEVDFQTFTADRYGDTQNFDLAPLKPCRIVAASESNKRSPLNPAKIKQLTGGNDVRCAFKHRTSFQL